MAMPVVETDSVVEDRRPAVVDDPRRDLNQVAVDVLLHPREAALLRPLVAAVVDPCLPREAAPCRRLEDAAAVLRLLLAETRVCTADNSPVRNPRVDPCPRVVLNPRDGPCRVNVTDVVLVVVVRSFNVVSMEVGADSTTSSNGLVVAGTGSEVPTKDLTMAVGITDSVVPIKDLTMVVGTTGSATLAKVGIIAAGTTASVDPIKADLARHVKAVAAGTTRAGAAPTKVSVARAGEMAVGNPAFL